MNRLSKRARLPDQIFSGQASGILHGGSIAHIPSKRAIGLFELAKAAVASLSNTPAHTQMCVRIS